jgi:hypothetical protein
MLIEDELFNEDHPPPMRPGDWRAHFFADAY